MLILYGHRNFQNHLQGNNMQNVIQIQLNLKTSLKMSSAKWRPFSFGDNVLTHSCGDNVALILHRRRFPCCLRHSLQMAVVLQTNIAGSFSRVANCCFLLMTLIILYICWFQTYVRVWILSMFIKIYFSKLSNHQQVGIVVNAPVMVKFIDACMRHPATIN